MDDLEGEPEVLEIRHILRIVCFEVSMLRTQSRNPLNDCVNSNEFTLFDLIEGSCVRYLEVNNCDGVNQAIDNCWSDLDKIFEKLTIVINDKSG